MIKSSRANELHDETLVEFKKDLERKGYRVILLSEKSPDGIAVKDGQIVAIEVLGKRVLKKKTKSGGSKYKHRYDGGVTKANKRRNYDMFDDVLFRNYIIKDERFD